MRPRRPPRARKGGFTSPALGLAVLAVAIAAGVALLFSGAFPRPEPLSSTPQTQAQTPTQSFDGRLPSSVSRALGATRDPAERWAIVQQLLAADREEDAISLLEHTVALLPEDAAAHEQLGEVLRASLRGGAGGAAEGEGDRSAEDEEVRAAWWERRQRAVAALNRSAALAPTAQLHATIGNLLAPRGQANSTEDAVGACQHYAAALALDPSAHAGTTGAAKRLAYISHALLCRRPLDEVCREWGGAHAQGCAPRAAEGAAHTARGGAIRLADWFERRVEALFNASTQLEPDPFDGTRARAAERMGAHGACEAHRRLGALGAAQRVHAAIAQLDCGSRTIRAWPRPTQTPTLQRQRRHELARGLHALRGAPPSRRRAVERAARRFQLNGVAVFEQVVPRALAAQLAALVANATAAAANTTGDARDGARRLTAHAPAGGLVGEAVALVAERLGRFLSAALGAPPGELLLLECATSTAPAGARASAWQPATDWRDQCEASAVLVQLALHDVSAQRAPLEVRVGVLSAQAESLLRAADAPGLRLPMRAGSAVVFSSDLMHRTAPNAAGSAASVLQTVWMASDDGLLPRQLSYHLPDGELGKWNLQRIIELRDGDGDGDGEG